LDVKRSLASHHTATYRIKINRKELRVQIGVNFTSRTSTQIRRDERGLLGYIDAPDVKLGLYFEQTQAPKIFGEPAHISTIGLIEQKGFRVFVGDRRKVAPECVYLVLCSYIH